MKQSLLAVVVVTAVVPLAALAASRSLEDKQVNNTLVKPALLREVINISKDIQNITSKGLEYYLINYGPLVKIFVTDFMDSFGISRNLQLAAPIVIKILIIGVYAAMQFQPSLTAFQQTAQSTYVFLKNFNSPELKIMNDLTDKVFEVFDNEIV
ncbi:uncharacterized protein [Procambarus clarkii]|uniref:uncharacterized protein n=1 Tax=Procambarus clarkii TaxID=6728 RepID=UPI001E675612|nr:uncharacterized protein LOC123754995 [Procambarus clarkii]